MDKKAEIYNAVAAINSGVGSIIASLKTLHEQGTIDADYLQQQTEIAEEFRAGINTTVTIKLHSAESDDWHEFGELRKTTEKRLMGEEANGDLPQVQPNEE